MRRSGCARSTYPVPKHRGAGSPVLRREAASPPEVVALYRPNVGKKADYWSVDRIVTPRPRRAVDCVELAGDQHIGKPASRRRLVHSLRQSVEMGRRPRRIDIADPPFEALGRHIDKPQKMPVP